MAQSQARIIRAPSLFAPASGSPIVSSTGQIAVRRAPFKMSVFKVRSDQRSGRGLRRLSTCSGVHSRSI